MTDHDVFRITGPLWIPSQRASNAEIHKGPVMRKAFPCHDVISHDHFYSKDFRTSLWYWKWVPSNLGYKAHLIGQWNRWSLRCSWSIACRRCSNNIFILDLIPGFNGSDKDNCKTRRETVIFLGFGAHYIRDLMIILPCPPVPSPPPPASPGWPSGGCCPSLRTGESGWTLPWTPGRMALTCGWRGRTCLYIITVTS